MGSNPAGRTTLLVGSWRSFEFALLEAGACHQCARWSGSRARRAPTTRAHGWPPTGAQHAFSYVQLELCGAELSCGSAGPACARSRAWRRLTKAHPRNLPAVCVIRGYHLLAQALASVSTGSELVAPVNHRSTPDPATRLGSTRQRVGPGLHAACGASAQAAHCIPTARR